MIVQGLRNLEILRGLNILGPRSSIPDVIIVLQIYSVI